MPSASNNVGSTRNCEELNVAIIGGGITGITLALGLSARGVRWTVYERAPALREIGAGVALSPNAERAIRILDPRAHAAFKRVAAPNGEDYFQWVDGTTDQLLFCLAIRGDGPEAFEGCRRSDFLEELAKLIAEDEAQGNGQVKFGKAIDNIEDVEGEDEDENGRVILTFKDGTSAEADVVIGCDGIHSRARQLLLGEDNPASYASYTQKFCFRTIVPITQVANSTIAHRAHTRFMFNGPGAHAITYPIGAKADFLNVLLVLSERFSLCPSGKRKPVAVGTRGDRREAIAAFKSWHPTVRAIVDLLPEDEVGDDVSEGKIQKWDIFDMHENPAPYYARGRVCLAGDAAHATSPHLGSGAGFGVEDALVLAEMLQVVNNKVKDGVTVSDGAARDAKQRIQSRAILCTTALQAYNEIRYDRTKWLPGASREACALFEWEHEAARDPERFGEEISQRFYQIWHYDVSGMVQEALRRFSEKID